MLFVFLVNDPKVPLDLYYWFKRK